MDVDREGLHREGLHCMETVQTKLRMSVVVPLLDERDNLGPLHARLVEVAEKLDVDLELIFVDDGSADGSAMEIDRLSQLDSRVIGLQFSRNFGHESASTAGLDCATGDCCVLMDADLQDPPETILEMFESWQGGSQIVFATRRTRAGESVFKKSTSWLFYRLMNQLSEVEMPPDTGDFRLIDKSVLDALRRCRETDRFVRGLVAWTGFSTAQIFYDRPAREHGVTKYNPLKLLLLSLDAAFGFSVKPLRIATYAGLVVTTLAMSIAAIVVFQKLFLGMPMQGYAALASGMFFLGGMQLLVLGILGEYVGRTYRQVQRRPLYLIAADTRLSRLTGTSDGPRRVSTDVRNRARPLVVRRPTPPGKIAA